MPRKSNKGQTVAMPSSLKTLWDIIPEWDMATFGTVNQTDVILPSVRLGSLLRPVYDGHEGQPPIAIILMYALALARRAGYTPDELCRECLYQTSVATLAGKEPHPQLPHVQPHTDIDHPANKLT